MITRHARHYSAVAALLLLGGASGCSASVSVGTPPRTGAQETPAQTAAAAQQSAAAAASQPQRPGTCQIAPPNVKLPIGEWTATETITNTYAIDYCKGQQLTRPWDFRHVCNAGRCKTLLYTASYYGPLVANVKPAGKERYIATFHPTLVPCPHNPGEDTGHNHALSTITFWWTSHRTVLHGRGVDRQVGACGGNPAETDNYTAVRTDPTANPPAPGP